MVRTAADPGAALMGDGTDVRTFCRTVGLLTATVAPVGTADTMDIGAVVCMMVLGDSNVLITAPGP